MLCFRVGLCVIHVVSSKSWSDYKAFVIKLFFCGAFCWYLTSFVIINTTILKVLCEEKWCLPILLKRNGEAEMLGSKNTHLKCLNEDTKDLIFLCLQHRALHKFKAHVKFKARYPLATATAELLRRRILLSYDCFIPEQPHPVHWPIHQKKKK